MLQTPEVVAELGINWNGDLDLLGRMVDAAGNAGCRYVKLQMRTPEIAVPRDQWDKERLWFDKKTTLRYIDYKKRMELSQKQLRRFSSYVRGRQYKTYHAYPNIDGMEWFASVWDVPALHRYLDIINDVGYSSIIKIPSAKITDEHLLTEVAKYSNYTNDTNDYSSYPHKVMMSTGMSTKDEIIDAINIMYAANPELDLIVMACNSSYPTDDKEVNLQSIQTLHDLGKKLDKNFLVGFSSHSSSPFPAIYSTMLNVAFIEVHFTLDRAMMGTDQAASLEPNGLELLVRESQRIPILWGDGQLKVYESEKAPREKLRG